MTIVSVETPWCWFACNVSDPTGAPSPDELAEHFERVSRAGCDHGAVNLNSRVSLISCPACVASPD